MLPSDSIAYDSLPLFQLDYFFPETDSVLVEVPQYFEQVTRHPLLGDWAVITIVAIILILASLRITSEKYLFSLIQSIFNRQTAQRMFRERVFNLMHPAMRLDIVFFFAFGIFLFQVEKYFYESIYLSDAILLLVNTAGVILFVYGKIVLYQFTGFIFNCQQEISEYLFYTKSGSRVMGIFLFPIAILMFFTEGIWSEILIILGVTAALLFSVISLFKGIRIIAQKDFSIYYLILYLCSLEILPLLIVWRILWSM